MFNVHPLHSQPLPGGAERIPAIAHDGPSSTPAPARRETKGDRKATATFASTRGIDTAPPQGTPPLARRVGAEPPAAAVLPAPQAQDFEALLRCILQNEHTGQASQEVPADPAVHQSPKLSNLKQYIADRLADRGPPHSPELLGALADVVRQCALKGNHDLWGERFSALVQEAGPADLTQEQLVPVFHHMVRGPESLGPDHICAAITAMCGLFEGQTLPAHWHQAMLQAARSAAGTATSREIERLIGAMLEGCICSIPDHDERQDALVADLLDLSLATCNETTALPVGFVAWVRMACGWTSLEQVTAEVLEAAERNTKLSPSGLKQMMAILSTGVVMRGSPSPDEVAQRLRALLVWSVKLPPAHRDGALAGLAGELARLIPSPAGAAYLQAVLSAIGQLREPIIEADAGRAVARFVGTLVAPVRERRTAGTWSDEPPEAVGNAGESETPSRPASPAEGDEHDAAPPSPALALAGLRTVLEHGTSEQMPLDWELLVMGQALAYANGGTGIAAATLLPMITGLAESAIPAAAAGRLLNGLTSGAGGTKMGDEAFAAFVEALSLADPVRGAVLGCYFCVAIQAAGSAGRALEVPVALRMAQALYSLSQPVRASLGLSPGEARLAPPLLLAVNLVDSPLEAVCSSELPRASQRELLQAAYSVPQLLDDSLVAGQALDCGLLAGRDLDFALDAAQALLGDPTRASKDLLRSLRAALLPGIVAATPSAGGDEARSRRLDRMAALYGSLIKPRITDTPAATGLADNVPIQDTERAKESKHSKAQPAASQRTPTPQAFLLEEAALMRTGPHAGLLEPLAAQLEAMAKQNGAS